MNKRVVEVQLENRVLEVKKLPILRYAELMKALKPILSQFDLFEKTENSELIAQLDVIVESNLPSVLSALYIATDLKKGEAEELGLDEIIDIVMAVIEVNNYKKIFDSIKKKKPAVQ